MIALRRNKKFCDECRSYDHRKWLWLGTHQTHRLYLRWQMKKAIRRSKKKGEWPK